MPRRSANRSFSVAFVSNVCRDRGGPCGTLLNVNALDSYKIAYVRSSFRCRVSHSTVSFRVVQSVGRIVKAARSRGASFTPLFEIGESHEADHRSRIPEGEILKRLGPLQRAWLQLQNFVNGFQKFGTGHVASLYQQRFLLRVDCSTSDLLLPTSKLKLVALPVSSETPGQRLARIRRERGYTQVELAQRTGLIQTLVSDYERGKLRLNADMIVRFAAALEVSTDDLLQPSGPKPSRKRKPSRRVLRRLELIEKLPRGQQTALLRTIDAVLLGVGRR